jgi:hypothetical protein
MVRGSCPAANAWLHPHTSEGSPDLERHGASHGGCRCEFHPVLGQRLNFSYGQSYQPGGAWPKFNLKGYSRMIDYEKGASREESVRTYLDPPELGGSALFVGELARWLF